MRSVTLLALLPALASAAPLEGPHFGKEWKIALSKLRSIFTYVPTLLSERSLLMDGLVSNDKGIVDKSTVASYIQHVQACVFSTFIPFTR